MKKFVILLCVVTTWAKPNLRLWLDGIDAQNSTERAIYEQTITVPVGPAIPFSNPQQYQVANVLVRNKFVTVATATLTLNCELNTPCATQSYVNIIMNTGATGRKCGSGTSSHKSVGTMTQELFSGTSIAWGNLPFYRCEIKAVASSACDCGRKPTVAKIVGGVKATAGEFPWILAAMKQGQTGMYAFCGSSLLSSRFVLTAAHCVTGQTPAGIILYGGSNKLMSTGTYIRIQSILAHPQYSSKTQQNDIALYLTASDVLFTEQLRPICLPFNMPTDTFSGKIATYSGWGILSEGGSSPNDLMKVDVPVKSNADCQKAMPSTSGYSIFPSSICTYGGNKDSCQGDSGGPLVLMVNNIFYQIGIVSWGDGCARPNKYGVNTRVTSYLSWIKANTNGICQRA